jgi:4-hydroxythreonine-4-phosphate dehydrogenase
MSRPPIRLAITLGDVNGIGPEVALKAAYDPRCPRSVQMVLVGDAAVVQTVARRLKLPSPAHITEPATWAERIGVYQPPDSPPLRYRPGQVRADAGRASATWVRAAVDGWRAGWWDAIVTAPIQKEAWGLAGIREPGHTEYLARLCGVQEVGMLLSGGGLNVLLATRHVPLRQVPEVLDAKQLWTTIAMAVRACPWLGLCGPVAVCGLNPHAGDGGVLGREEQKWIAPLIRRARRRGWPVTGPWPADTVFYRARQGEFAIVIALYHDQGLPTLKTLAMDRGVNITLGLPLVRTSPDHGTAMDIAGQNLARSDSMLEAIRRAVQLARRPNPWARRTCA